MSNQDASLDFDPRKIHYMAIFTQHDYHALVATGMAWEVYPELELTWEKFKAAQDAWIAANSDKLEPDIPYPEGCKLCNPGRGCDGSC